MVRSSGVTRIDTSFANPAALALLDRLEHRWDLGIPSHVGLQVFLKVPVLGALTAFHLTPTRFELSFFEKLRASEREAQFTIARDCRPQRNRTQGIDGGGAAASTTCVLRALASSAEDYFLSSPDAPARASEFKRHGVARFRERPVLARSRPEAKGIGAPNSSIAFLAKNLGRIKELKKRTQRLAVPLRALDPLF